jgi:hypothetical protein
MKDYVSKLMVPVLEVDTVNKNNRFYPKELILEKAEKWKGKMFPVVIGMPDGEKFKRDNFSLPIDSHAGTCYIDPQIEGNFLYACVHCFNFSNGETLQRLIDTVPLDFRTISVMRFDLKNNIIHVTDFNLVGIAALPKGQGA